jgi:hypothetical protein
VAQNWITLIIENEGSWGGAESASPSEMYDLKQGDRLLGYLLRIRPQGYIVVSLYTELPPVQAYSDSGDFDPESDTQKEGIIKEQMAQLLDDTEGLTHPQLSIQSEVVRPSSQAGNRSAWEALGHDNDAFVRALQSGTLTVAYESGKWLLTSTWHQGDPYNRKCPEPVFPLQSCLEARCSVGCTPLAGAQIMRYWAWPPQYDWPNMPDKLDGNSPPAQIDAVATLCRDVGNKAGAVYCMPGFGCETLCSLVDTVLIPGIPGDLMEALVDDFGYHEDADEDIHYSESDAEWFSYFKEELNKNRPVPYELGVGFSTGWHTVVCDGWREVGGMKELHLNYGWDGNDSDQWWYTLNTMPHRTEFLEHIIKGLRPNCAVGPIVSGIHAGLSAASYVYFDQDAISQPSGSSVDVKYLGYNCQFLPGVRLKAELLSPITFVGSPSPLRTRLVSIKGTATASIKINLGGAMTLRDGGGIRFF